MFFGSLRPLEVEVCSCTVLRPPYANADTQRLYEQMRFSIPESLLAFTMFRDELDVPFAFMFGFLLFVKCFHWLMADRVEWVCHIQLRGIILAHIYIDGSNALSRAVDALPHSNQHAVLHSMGRGLCDVYRRSREYVGQRYHGYGVIRERGEILLRIHIRIYHIT